MAEYQGVKYKHLNGAQWLVVWPSGLKGTMTAIDEDALKAKIDELKAQVP